jgi:hypothetical protein
MFRWIAIIAAVALAAGAAFGQSSSPPSAQPTLPLGSGQTMGHHMTNGEAVGPSSMMDPSMMPMMQMMRMMHMMDAGMMGPGTMKSGMPMICDVQPGMTMAGAPGSYLEARLAFVKAELAIDQTQDADWQKYAGAVRDRAQPMISAMSGMHRAAADGSNFLGQFDARIESLEEQLSGLKAIRGAAVGLYDHLNQVQKRKADTLLPMSLCM